MVYRNVMIDQCRSCERQDHNHWQLEPEREPLERYRQTDGAGRKPDVQFARYKPKKFWGNAA